MKTQEIKFKSVSNSYSIVIGKNIIKFLPRKIKTLCPNVKKIAIIYDNKVPIKFKRELKNLLKSYDLFFLKFVSSERSKSIVSVSSIIEKLLAKNYHRSDLIICVGGGISGDTVGFISSIYKRG